MKFSNNDINQFKCIIDACTIAGIDSIILDSGTLRGINGAKTCAIISNFQVPNLSQKIGITRLSALKQRVDVFGSNSFCIETKESSRDEISSIEVSSGRNKVQFRCTSTAMIKAPVNINDDACFKIFITKDEMKMILDAVKVMSSKKIIFNVKSDRTVTVEAVDTNNDVFKISLESPVELLGDEDSTVQYYLSDIICPIIRCNMNDLSTVSYTIGQKGTLQINLMGHNVTVMPQIGDETED